MLWGSDLSTSQGRHGKAQLYRSARWPTQAFLTTILGCLTTLTIGDGMFIASAWHRQGHHARPTSRRASATAPLLQGHADHAPTDVAPPAGVVQVLSRFFRQREKKNKIGHHAIPRRASATAPLLTGADTFKTGSGQASAPGQNRSRSRTSREGLELHQGS